jgi:tRNA (cytidine/uridine-2'-O-)-methyltransferase
VRVPDAEALLRVVLVEPEIPGNTGNVGRICAGTDTPLHLVGRLGFSLDDRHLKRAGLDYWPAVRLHLHPDLADLRQAVPRGRRWLFSTRAPQLYTDVSYAPGDVLVFGCETRGLPEAVLDSEPDEHHVRIPTTGAIRSLNLANAVAAAVFEALRQLGWRGQ